MDKKCSECFHCKKVTMPNKDRFIMCEMGEWEKEQRPKLTFKQFEELGIDGNIWFNRIARTCDDECFMDRSRRGIIINSKGDIYEKDETEKANK